MKLLNQISNIQRISDVFGIRIEEFWRCRDLEVPEEVEMQINRNPETGLEVLKEITHQVCAVSKNSYGKGNAYYIFSETNEVILTKLLERVLDEIEIEMPLLVPEGILVREIAENQLFFLNITGKDISIDLEKNGYRVLKDEMVFGKMLLKAYDGELVEIY